MSQRLDPMYYEFDIQDLKSGEVQRARMFCWLSGDASIAGLRAMCDCQLGGFFIAASKNIFPTWEHFRHGTGSGNANNAFVHGQHMWLKQHQCKCASPSKKYAVRRAITPDGGVIELSDGREAA
jgi:hypothetical protein